jgi:hypothetical protein
MRTVDATVEMNDDVEQITYSPGEEVDEDSDATEMEDDAELETNSAGDETKMKSNVLGDEFRICNTVCTEDEIFILNSHFRHHTTNAKMLFL